MAKYILILTIGFVFTGCGVVEPYWSVLRGNYSFSRGEYQTAIVRYFEALDHGHSTPWILYNLGNVYYALGETEAALRTWYDIEQFDDVQIRFGVSFNRGVLFFEMGRYADAYAEFRRALRLAPSDVDAKINVELAFQRMTAGEQAQAVRSSETQSRPEVSGEESVRILEYMRRREGRQWIATDAIEEPVGGNDW